MNVNNEILSQNIKIKKIPRFIKNKILFLKIFAVFQMLIALSLITILTFTLLIYYQNDHNNYYQSVMKSVMSKLAINDAINSIFNKIIDYFKIDLIPYPILLFFLLVVAVLIFFYGFFNLKLI